MSYKPALAVGQEQVNARRLLGRIAEMSRIGGTADGGVTRLAYSEEDLQARRLVAGWLAEAGIPSRIDQAGNLLATLPGAGGLPGMIATGSHLDTVVRGGRFDGTYGVLAALETLVQVAESGVALQHDLTMVVFSNEEGANGTPGMVGSQIVAGATVDVDRPDHDGVRLGERIAAVDGDPSALAEARWADGSVAAFVEIHIEQGPVLEASCAEIGIVTCITGRSNLDITITGRQQHAGTTPMVNRCDALVVASDMIRAVDEMAREGIVRVATTGRITCEPNVWNVVPGSVRLTVDLRDEDPRRIADGVARVRAVAASLSDATGAVIDVHQGPEVPPVTMNADLADCITTAARQWSLKALPMPSGAGHDAQLVARIAPTAMCFIPSVGGVSHAPEEDSHDHHLIAGANVLLRAIRLIDERLSD